MPFIQVSSLMAERRAGRRRTRQQFEVEQLTSRFQQAQQQASAGFQAEQQGILQDFQQQMEAYGQQMESYEAQARRFQEATESYNQAVDRYNTLNRLDGVQFVALPRADRPATFLSAQAGRSQAEWDRYLTSTATGQALMGIPSVETDVWAIDQQSRIRGFDAAQLPDTFALSQVGTSGGGYPIFELAQRGGPDPGEFMADLGPAPDAPTAPSVEGLGQQFTASLEREREFFEREIGERRAASMRARRRIGARPLLSGE